MATKTRNLSIYEFFEILQQEYIVCILRSKIYPLQKHVDYWVTTAEKKKEKILDIGKRNKLPTIFDNEHIYSIFEKKIILEYGFPNFIYKDEAQKIQQEKWDILNYYSIGKEFKFYNNISHKYCIGLLDSMKDDKCFLLFDNKKIELNLDSITRVI